MNRRGWNAAGWAAQLSVGIVALSWLLSKLGPSQRHLALLGIFSAGVLLLVDAALLHGWIRELREQLHELRDEVLRLEKEQPNDALQRKTKQRDDLDHQRRTLLLWRNWFLRVSASLALISVGFISSLCCPPGGSPSNPQSTVRFSDQVEKALVDYLASTSKLGGQGQTANGVLKLDASMEAALRQHLQNPPAPAGIPPWGILLLIVLALGVLIGVIWWSLSRKPEATPLTVAIATLTAVSAVIEKLVGKGQIQPFRNVPWLVAIVALTLLILGIVLLFQGLRCLFSIHRSPDPDFAKRESLLGAALLVFGFSAALLALVPPLLFHGEQTLANHCPPCPTQGPMGAQKLGVFSLYGIDGLGDGRRPEDKNIGREKIEELTGDLSKNKAQGGDILLLLGSADCVATKPKNKGGLWDNNEDLANARANWVKDGLQLEAAIKDIKIETLPLPQHARCGPAHNVRAVYPILIHGEGN